MSKASKLASRLILISESFKTNESKDLGTPPAPKPIDFKDPANTKPKFVQSISIDPDVMSYVIWDIKNKKVLFTGSKVHCEQFSRERKDIELKDLKTEIVQQFTVKEAKTPKTKQKSIPESQLEIDGINGEYVTPAKLSETGLDDGKEYFVVSRDGDSIILDIGNGRKKVFESKQFISIK